MQLQISSKLLVVAACSAHAFFDPKYAQENGTSPAIPVDISRFYNNRAFASGPSDANFDGAGNGYSSTHIPPTNFIYSGINFTFPSFQGSVDDNVRSAGQAIPLRPGRYFSAHFFAAAESGSLIEGLINATYSDGSSVSSAVLVPVWWYDYLFGGDIVFPFYFSEEGVDFNKSMIYLVSSKLDSSKELVSLHLPADTSGIHIFSLSMWRAASTDSIQLEVQMARSTQKWTGDNEIQIVEVLINNVGTGWVQGADQIQVTIQSTGYKTLSPARIKRLRPGDQVKVEVGVVATSAVRSTGPATVVVLGGNKTYATYDFLATFGVVAYDSTFESIYTHESPGWYDDSKYGIFIHWGLYSLPAWGNLDSNETYAEWYWWNMNAGPDTSDQTYQFNLETYGPDHNYDDFMGNFTASGWDPKEWVDLFADAGAKYFVQVTKHHDGFALFDVSSNATLRTSVAQSPHRNFVKELFDAADLYQPHLRKGTYFSLPEWFNPAYGPYGMGRWPGKNATNPYTNQTLPYTGFVEISDFLKDIMLPQMEALAALGTDIIWCDASGANISVEFAAPWFNAAKDQSRQVVMNNRCGIPGDFDTPEYSQLNIPQSRKWESNLGMDPFSYGYNRVTASASYMNASSIVTTLIDVVSKNGNLLLDIGPTGNGSILQVEKDNLLDAGAWIQSHGEAIYNTTYWFFTPGGGESVRFTQTLDAFYIHLLEKPGPSIIIDSPVPYIAGDQITAVGGKLHGTPVGSNLLANGSLVIRVSEEVIAADEYAWVFKISF